MSPSGTGSTPPCLSAASMMLICAIVAAVTMRRARNRASVPLAVDPEAEPPNGAASSAPARRRRGSSPARSARHPRYAWQPHSHGIAVNATMHTGWRMSG